jgi:xanthine/CO dehydrogenase XdhC/CoxF family maturation factor
MIKELQPLYLRERSAGRALALAVVLRTAGSTYSKPGASLLIAQSGDLAGLLSGGCLEGDLREHARQVIAEGTARIIHYDTRGPEDLLFGLGAGCEGAMDIIVLRVGAETGWEPLAHLYSALAAHRETAVGLVIESEEEPLRAGEILLPGRARDHEAALAAAAHAGVPSWLVQTPRMRIFTLPLVLPPRILLLGAGTDAQPVVELAARLGWKATLYDHRPALMESARFPDAERMILGRPEALARELELENFDAAVVMSHHLESDCSYLRALGTSGMGYIGLLGPVSRRERIRSTLGADFNALKGKLRSPVGLALGGRTSASIALAIVAEIHAWLHGSHVGSFSREAQNSECGCSGT